MRSSYKVVPATAEHVSSLPEIERLAATLFRDQVPAQLLEHTTPESILSAAQRDGALWVAIGPDDEPVGFARIEREGKRVHLAELDVLPAHGRRGVGTALVRSVEEWAISNDFAELTLTTYREFPWNGPFYAGLGFVVVPEGDCDDDLLRRLEEEVGADSERERRVVMRRSLSSVPHGFAGELRSIVDSAQDDLRATARGDLDEPREPGAWSRIETLGHLVDSAANNHQRYVRAQDVEELSFPDYDQEVWVARQEYRSCEWLGLVDLWVAYNRHLAHVLDVMPAATLETRCRLGDSSEVSLRELIMQYLAHTRHHLAQLAE